MQALKALVIGMGILIVLAVFLLGYGLYKRTVEPDWKLFGPQSATESGPSNIQVFGDVSLGLADGCRISSVHADGPRAFVMIGPSNDCAEVIVLDIQSGKILGRLGP